MANTGSWIKAFRLRTLPLSFACILMGGFMALDANLFDGGILALSLLTTLFLQVLSNLANDYGDAVSGVDSDLRTGPSRTIQAGLITKSQMKRAMIICGILAFASGLLLLFVAFGDQWAYFMTYLGIGIASIIAAIAYTVGKKPYGYLGLGDLFVFIFFGLVGVYGSYFLYTKYLDPQVILTASACGFLSMGVLNVNNIRDIESDEKAGKRSIPVRIGKNPAIIYHAFLLAGAAITSIFYAYLNFENPYSWVFLSVMILWARNLLAVIRLEGMQLDPFLRQLAISTLLFVLLFGLGVYLG